MRVIAAIALALVLTGCSHPGNTATNRSAPVACRIIERVYYGGWATCGEISVSPTGDYSWTVLDIWHTPPHPKTFAGQLPSTISEPVIASSVAFARTNGVPVCEVYIDDWRAQYPAGVDQLRQFLFAKHGAQK
jgi:hypothetical protein